MVRENVGCASRTVHRTTYMTRSELIEWVSKQQKDFLYADVAGSVCVILDYLSESLALGRRIEIRGFGSFSLRYRASRLARNPKTGEKVPLCAKYVPHFKASRILFNRMNHP